MVRFRKLMISIKSVCLLLLLNAVSTAQDLEFFHIKKQVKICNYSLDSNKYHLAPNSIYLKEVSNYKYTKVSDFDTLKIIEQLLSFEENTQLCALPTKSYYPTLVKGQGIDVLCDTDPNDKCMHYSLQVEALYIINILCFEEPFVYAPYPIIGECLGDYKYKLHRIDGVMIKEAYRCYKRWFKTISKLGITEAKRQNITPFSYAQYGIRWFPNCNPE